MKIDVMGVLFDNVTMEQALDRAETLMEAKASAYCVTPNGEIVWEAMQDPAFRSILNEADLVLPDGASVVLGSRILERPLQEKVAGIAFAEALVQRMAARGGRLYLLGGRPGIAEKAAENLTAKYPGLVICGTADGYFRDEAAVVEQVRKAEPEFTVEREELVASSPRKLFLERTNAYNERVKQQLKEKLAEKKDA